MRGIRAVLLALPLVATWSCTCGPGQLGFTVDVRVEPAGSGRVDLGSGRTCDRSCTFALTAATDVSVVAASNSVFAGFEGLCQGTGACRVSGDGELVARFGRRPIELTVEVRGLGRVKLDDRTCGPAATCQWTLEETGPVLLRAEPNPRSRFLGWADPPCQGADANCVPDLSLGSRVTASFSPVPLVELKVDILGADGGVRVGPYGTCHAPCTVLVNSQERLTVSSEEGPGALFEGWSGRCTGNAPSCEFLMLQDEELSAQFSPRCDTQLTVSGPVDSGIVSWEDPSRAGRCAAGATCALRTACGAEVRLQSIPNAGVAFSGWSGSCSGFAPQCSVDAGGVLGVRYVPWHVGSWLVQAASVGGLGLFSDGDVLLWGNNNGSGRVGDIVLPSVGNFIARLDRRFTNVRWVVKAPVGNAAIIENEVVVTGGTFQDVMVNDDLVLAAPNPGIMNGVVLRLDAMDGGLRGARLFSSLRDNRVAGLAGIDGGLLLSWLTDGMFEVDGLPIVDAGSSSVVLGTMTSDGGIHGLYSPPGAVGIRVRDGLLYLSGSQVASAEWEGCPRLPGPAGARALPLFAEATVEGRCISWFQGTITPDANPQIAAGGIGLLGHRGNRVVLAGVFNNSGPGASVLSLFGRRISDRPTQFIASVDPRLQQVSWVRTVSRALFHESVEEGQVLAFGNAFGPLMLDGVEVGRDTGFVISFDASDGGTLGFLSTAATARPSRMARLGTRVLVSGNFARATDLGGGVMGGPGQEFLLELAP